MTRTLCRAESPSLLVGDFGFQGGRCRESWGHWGPHRNRDGTVWPRRGQTAIAWGVLGAVLLIAGGVRVVTGRRAQ